MINSASGLECAARGKADDHLRRGSAEQGRSVPARINLQTACAVAGETSRKIERFSQLVQMMPTPEPASIRFLYTTCCVIRTIIGSRLIMWFIVTFDTAGEVLAGQDGRVSAISRVHGERRVFACGISISHSPR